LAKNKTARVDWIRTKAPFADRVSFWLRTETLGTEGALWFLLDVIITPVGNRFVGGIRRRERPAMKSWYMRREMPRGSTGVFPHPCELASRPRATASGFWNC